MKEYPSARLALVLAALLTQPLLSQTFTFTGDAQIGVNDTSFDGLAIVVSNCTLTVDGPHTFSSLQILSGGTVTHTYMPNGMLPVNNQSYTSSVPTGLTLTVSNNLMIVGGGRINVDGKGYGGGQGPGRGSTVGSPTSGGGAGHGGNGGYGAGLDGIGAVYEPPQQPVDKGSGGGGLSGTGGSGGGSVKLIVGGALLVDGAITANGSDATSDRTGGGAGGSIWVISQTLAGSGTITANGGGGELPAGGGGGGGRIALQADLNVFLGTASAFGGNGYTYGGAGTIYSTTAGQTGQVLVDNAGHAGLTTLLPSQPAFDLTAQAGAVVVVSGAQTFGNLVLHSNAWLVPTNTGFASSQLTLTGNATIDSGAGITVDSAGFPANQGGGAGRSSSYPVFTGGGGGFGGNGASGGGLSAFGGASYGLFTEPGNAGSGGASLLGGGLGSAGGGAIRLTVTGTLVVNGRISAEGGQGLYDGSGGGSGGSIWLNAGLLAGGGLISANGGMGNGFGLYGGGGGGGGRIAIQSGMNLFLGAISARGGGGSARGGAGTIYTTDRNKYSAQLLVDNGGTLGTNTLLASLYSPGVDVTVQGGAVVTLPSQSYFGNILIVSNSWIVLSNQDSQTLNASGNLTIRPGGGMILDGGGYPAGSGPGAGRYSQLTGGGSTGGGAGYGGYGGDGFGNTSFTLRTGGTTYGSMTSPVDRGSGGGGSSSYSTLGGAGGGSLHLIVAGMLDVDGLLTANGNSGATAGGGGGSGGSLWLSVGTLSGLGTISANGGGGNGVGGGGGGGRIAIQYSANVFTGTFAARGGAGMNRGGAGTIFSKANGQYVGQLVIDNGGLPGTNTSWASGGTVDLTITGGAVASPPAQQTIGNLLIGPSSVLLITNQSLSIMGNAFVQAGGAILADGNGLGPGQGLGGGRYGENQSGASAGGGGHGGYGANGATAMGAGGNCYGSLTAPTELGSGGGGSYTLATGGSGGGAIRLNVTGSLQVNGRVSANGASGAVSGGGGGSGGSIWLNAATLSGSGQITANGGNGTAQSGGGGGGRVSLFCNTNGFDGIVSAYGGGGYAWGGAGTIYIKSTTSTGQSSQVIVDNGGQSGTNTTWLTEATFDLTIRGGGVAVPPAGQAINNLLINSNGWLSLNNRSLAINANANVQAGGGIVADGAGNPGNLGYGAGRFSNVPGYGYIGGGGGYGGYGASGTFATQAFGGLTYGSLLAPTDLGSGGGGYSAGYGGPGGGAIRLNILGGLILNGKMSAQGMAGVVPGAGGGSGGSIWLTVGTLGGAGLISANGGDGNGLGGGGGGGRIVLQYATNIFMGPITAFGGGGSNWGGAGTVYLKRNNQAMGQVLVDNGGRFGTNTTISSLSSAFDLTVRNGAGVNASSSSLLLSNLNIGPGGLLSLSSGPTNLTLTILRDAVIQSGGELVLDGKGYSAMTGPGSGSTSNAIGSGGGYGGKGGASLLQAGGAPYGSALQPIDRGSSGGFGYGTWTGGSEGGGALRLIVGRALTVNGIISANGNDGRQDDAGGGSGGSLWLSAAVFDGTGLVSVMGGAGELPRGGGGGGGRIAINSPANVFGGVVTAAGGGGFTRGTDGTVYYSASLPVLQVVGQSPAGSVTYAITSVDFSFNTPVNPYTVFGSDAAVMTPSGPLSSGDVILTSPNPTTVRVSFPPQSIEGSYTFSFGSQLQDLYGQPVSQVCTGALNLVWPVVQGMVTDAQQHPLAGVLLQPDGGLAATSTDANGSYSVKVRPSQDVTIVPSLNNLVFVPRSLSYWNVSAPLDLQNYLAVDSIVPNPAVQYQAAGMVLDWQGIQGVTYQAVCSTNLIDWSAYGAPIIGTNGPAQLSLPYDSSPQMFFRLGASN